MSLSVRLICFITSILEMCHLDYNYTFYGVNKKRYTGEVEARVVLNEVNEWKILNDRALDGSEAIESHPFHMHTNHFQVSALS